MENAQASPPFPGPNGPPGDVGPLLRLTLGQVNEGDLRAIAAADYGLGETRVLELLHIPRREGRWPTSGDAGDHAFEMHECCSLVLTASDRGRGGAHRWRLLFAAGAITHMVYSPGYRSDTWTDLRIAQMLMLAMELGPEAARAVRAFIAWMRERVPANGYYASHDYDAPLLLLDAATGGDAPVDDERVIDLYTHVLACFDNPYAQDEEGTLMERALWSNWFDDPAALSRDVAASVHAMAPTDLPPAMAELLASMVERREPAF